MIVEWFTPTERPTLEWFGQTSGTLATIQRRGVSAVASVVGPRGIQGPVGPQGIQGPQGESATQWQITDW